MVLFCKIRKAVHIPMTKRVVLYARQSRDGISVANQLLILTEVANSKNWFVVKAYGDDTINYTKDKTSGAEFRELCKALTQSEVDLVMVFSIDRLGKSLQELVTFLSDLQASHIDLYLHKQELDTSTPEGKPLFSLCRLFGEFENSIISERVTAGINRARSQGKTLGRPRVSPETEHQILTYRAQGMAMKPIARTLKIGTSVVQRVLRTDS